MLIQVVHNFSIVVWFDIFPSIFLEPKQEPKEEKQGEKEEVKSQQKKHITGTWK